MDTEKVTDIALTALDDAQAENVKTINIRQLSSVADKMIICSARSPRHLHAIADKIVHAFKQQGQSCHVVGKHSSEWVLVDLGNVVIHIMLPQTREYYNLEKLWKECARNNLDKF